MRRVARNIYIFLLANDSETWNLPCGFLKQNGKKIKIS